MYFYLPFSILPGVIRPDHISLTCSTNILTVFHNNNYVTCSQYAKAAKLMNDIGLANTLQLLI